MKKFIKIFTLVALFTFAINISKADIYDNQVPVIIKKGTFVRVMSQREISTATSDIGDEVSFINTTDMYVNDTNAIPQNSILYGAIEDLKEPVQGTNAAMKIKITKIVTPSRKIISVNGYVSGSDDNYIGGELTSPLYYNKMPHYTAGWRGGVLQYAPLNIRSQGQHTTIKAGNEFFVVIMDDLKIN